MSPVTASVWLFVTVAPTCLCAHTFALFPDSHSSPVHFHFSQEEWQLSLGRDASEPRQDLSRSLSLSLCFSLSFRFMYLFKYIIAHNVFLFYLCTLPLCTLRFLVKIGQVAKMLSTQFYRAEGISAVQTHKFWAFYLNKKRFERLDSPCNPAQVLQFVLTSSRWSTWSL